MKNTKDIILQKTFGLMLRKGYDGVSISVIQESTAMARGLLYHYFGSQENLFREAVRKYQDQWFHDEPKQFRNCVVGDLISHVVKCYEQMGQELADEFGEGISLLDVEVLFCEAMRHDDSFAASWRGVRSSRSGMWKTVLLNSFAAGELRSGLNLESVARQFALIPDGVIADVSGAANLPDTVYAINKGLRDFLEIIRR